MTTVNSSTIYRSVATLANIIINQTNITSVIGGASVNSVVTPSVLYRTTVGGGSSSGGGGSTTYSNATPVPVTIGGITAGTTFASAQTMQQMWDALLYPYQTPSFTSLSITGQATSQEVGYTIPVGITFTWSTSNSGNVSANTISIADVTRTITLGSGLANTGSYGVTMGSSIQKTTAASHVFSISATNTQLASLSRNLTINWYWRLFYGTQTNSTLTGANILALASSNLATGYAGSYSYGTGGYKYICFADAGGGQLNSVKDNSTGFSVPMATSATDASYSNIDGGGFYYALVSVTNSNSVTTNYRVYRSLYVLGGAIVLNIT